MMKIKLVSAFAMAAAALGAAPALAQDTSGDKPYDGVYVGVSGGYDIQKNDVGAALGFDRDGNGTFQDAVTTAAGADAFSTGYCNGRARDAVRQPTGCENDRNRASYYARVGVDRQYGPFVIGLVGEFGKTGIRDYTSAYSTTPASYVFARGVTWEASAGLRAGFAADQTLFYGVGKFGYARLDHDFTTTNTANSFSVLVNDKDRKGFIVGGGLEQRIMKRFSIGLEYSYHDYKDKDFKVLATRGTAAATNPFVLAPFTAGTVLRRQDDNFRWHSLRATVGYHF